ncbi:MAG: hypothetical protein EOR57_31630 [Mesorhizobium sp.]|uniref:hypothetical protein n=1 Tax=Mesorhizobium sp. TaxID=1871066 RepID=UPI000FE51171|nr:hypothetical protein [Mesorhizobium sp.]RWL14899.1 MAG: hypothetical protein EOR57_31630 [Mesorhizobium sp.]
MGPIIRIFLRYATFPLLYFGVINSNEASDLIADPQIAQWVSLGAGIVAPFVSEGWYWLALRFGWAK